MNSTTKTSDYTKMQEMLRAQQYSMSTERSYLAWVKRYYEHYNKHPRTMGKQEIQDYLSYLAIERHVAAATQNQALHALLFLYKHVLNVDVQGIKATRAKKTAKVPMILSQTEVITFLSAISPPSCHCLGMLYYGSGLRLMEGVRLRIKDIDFQQGHILVHNGKGQKDRIVPLMPDVVPFLHAQITQTERIWKRDLSEGFGEVYLPHALTKKNPHAATSWQYQYIFISKRRSIDPRDGKEKRQHINPATVQGAVKRASAQLFKDKRITCHCLRHSWATHLIEHGKTLKEVSVVLGHADTRTTERYIHLARHQKPFFSLEDLDID